MRASVWPNVVAIVAASAMCVTGCDRQSSPPQGAPTSGDEAAMPPAQCERTTPPEQWATKLRGEMSAPDPRMVQTLTDKGYGSTEQELRRALDVSDDQTLHLAALTAVSVLGCPSLTPSVVTHLSAPAPTAVEAAATLVEIGDAEQARAGHRALESALADASWPTVQLTAAAYLARNGDEIAIDPLYAALASTEEAIRIQAVNSIRAFAGFDGRAFGGKTFDRLSLLDAVLTADESWLVRRTAAYQIAALPPSERRAALLANTAEHDRDERVRQAAAAALP